MIYYYCLFVGCANLCFMLAIIAFIFCCIGCCWDCCFCFDCCCIVRFGCCCHPTPGGGCCLGLFWTTSRSDDARRHSSRFLSSPPQDAPSPPNLVLGVVASRAIILVTCRSVYITCCYEANDSSSIRAAYSASCPACCKLIASVSLSISNCRAVGCRAPKP